MIVVLFAAVSYGAWWLRTTRWQAAYKIENPKIAPATMNDEGGGSAGPFFPASVEVANNAQIPNEFFMESETCKQCHADIYRQWESSAHHFSSFNNQWYRKSIEYMQDTVGIRPSKWCAGCHDPALLLTGMFDRPVREVENTPEGQAGLGCVMCHSIVAVQSTMGQNNYVLEYPPLNDLATSKNPVVHHLVDFLLKLNPEPHRRVFMKPFVKNQTAEFCSSCHKVHLDFPVNHYRWTRGFNEYDNWQASGVSGEGARSFYYPPHPQTCTDCHMPAVHSGDFGNYAGVIHSHRFPAANTALPYENEDTQQLDAVEKFLKANQVSVDIFGISPEQSGVPRCKPLALRRIPRCYASDSDHVRRWRGSAVSSAVGPARTRYASVSPHCAVWPLPCSGSSRRHRAHRRGCSHAQRRPFLPRGHCRCLRSMARTSVPQMKTAARFSGVARQGANGNGDGPVDSAAQFYRSLLIDAHGNPSTSATRGPSARVIYVRLIPPGAADTIHYRLYIPKNAGNRITLTAKLNYRKFSWWFTQFSFAGIQDPNQQKSRCFSQISTIRSGPSQEARRTIPASAPAFQMHPLSSWRKTKPNCRCCLRMPLCPNRRSTLKAADWRRWNDYGIGLLLQGDLQGAESAFERVAQAAPNRGDG